MPPGLTTKRARVKKTVADARKAQRSAKPTIVTTNKVKTLKGKNVTPREGPIQVPTDKITQSKTFQDALDATISNINIDREDIPEGMEDDWDDFDEEIRPKLAKKNLALWAAIFSPIILPGIVKGMRSEPTVAQPKVIIKGRQQEVIPPVEPKQIVDFTRKYFEEHGLELCKSLTETDLNNIKQDLINNWGKGPKAFSEAFKNSYPVSQYRLETIYRSERHIAEYQGVIERAKIADHSKKQWRAVGDERSCDLCMSYDMEIVDIGEPFSNGEMTAIGHPNCRCSMITLTEDEYSSMPDEEIYQDQVYLQDVSDFMKLNYNCPDSEKTGSGPGSCSGSESSQSKILSLKNKIKELEKSVSEGKSTFDNSYEKYKLLANELKLEMEKEKSTSNNKNINNIITEPEPVSPEKALSDYQNYAYTAINDYLRKSNMVKQDPHQTKNIQNLIKTIDSEMNANPLKSDILVFRADNGGISTDAFEKLGITKNFKDIFNKDYISFEDTYSMKPSLEKILNDKLVGYEYKEKAFMSTGRYKENVMNRFLSPSLNLSPYGITGLVNLMVPKGTNALQIAKYTGLEDELGGKIDEYLIDRDQTVVIDHVFVRPADDDRFYLEFNAHIKSEGQKQNSSYLDEVSYFIKQNHKYPEHGGSWACEGQGEPEKEHSSYLSDVANFYKENSKCKAGTFDESNKCGPEKENKTEDTLTLQEKQVVDYYQRTGYGKINSLLRNTKTTAVLPQEKSIVEGQIKQLESAISKSKISQEIKVFKGIGSKYGLTDNMESLVGTIFTDPGFCSTSTSVDSAAMHARSRRNEFSGKKEAPEKGVIAVIKLPVGTHAMDIAKAVPELTERSKQESEVLVQHGTQFKVTAVDKSGPYWRVDMEAIPNQKQLTFSEVSSNFNPELGGFHTTDYKSSSEKPLRVISQDKSDNAKLLEALKDIPSQELPSQFLVMKMVAGTPAKYYTKTDSIGVDKGLSSSEMTIEIKKVLQGMKTNSAYLEEVSDFIKLNYKCKKEDSPDGTNKCASKQEPTQSNNNPMTISEPTEEMDDKLKTYESTIKSKLSEKEIDLLDNWAGNYSSINSALFSKTLSPMTELMLSEKVPIMDEAMKKSTLDSDIVTYRGMDQTKIDSILGACVPGREFTYKGFMSTSTSKKWSRNFFSDEGGTFRITVPKGTHAIYKHENNVRNRMITERELLLDRGMKFKVTSVTEEPGMFHPLKIINLEVVK
jgi:hypothetical protein